MAGKKTYDDGGSGLKVTYDGVPKLFAALNSLTRSQTLVGVPAENTDRPPNPDDPKSAGITNAALAYIHDNGAPEANIPARPFMIPGIMQAMPKVEGIMLKMAQYALKGSTAQVEAGYQRVGFECVNAITSIIRAGIAPPLAEMTLRKRLAKGDIKAQYELNRRAAGYGATTQLVKPLMDTNEMLKSITYVVRDRIGWAQQQLTYTGIRFRSGSEQIKVSKD